MVNIANLDARDYSGGEAIGLVRDLVEKGLVNLVSLEELWQQL
jgi:hypothetical protein